MFQTSVRRAEGRERSKERLKGGGAVVDTEITQKFKPVA